MDPNGKRLRDWETLRTSSTAKFIRKNHKLAFGSDSVIFMNNIVVQHQRKSTVPAEVPGPVFPSSVHRLFLLWFTSFSNFLLHLSNIWHDPLSPGRHPTFFPCLRLSRRPVRFLASSDHRPREINKVKQVRLFLSWKHKNLDSYPIPRAFADICSCTWFWNVCVIQKCQLCLSVSEFAGIPEWV